MLLIFSTLVLIRHLWRLKTVVHSSWSKGISETNLKLQIPCSKCMQQPCDQPMMSQANACTYCMHCPMMSQAILHGLCCFNFISYIPLLQLLCSCFPPLMYNTCCSIVTLFNRLHNTFLAILSLPVPKMVARLELSTLLW